VGRLDAIVVRDTQDGPTRRLLDRCGSDVVIVRPDRIVFGWGVEGNAALADFSPRFSIA